MGSQEMLIRKGPRLIYFMVWSLPILLGACGLGDPGAIWVDPGKFTFYRCEDLARRWKVLVEREKELRGLIEKANESSGGAVIGSIAYRSDYEAALSEEKLLQHVSTEKNCALTQEYQSDHTIR